MIALGLALAVVSALALNFGYYRQHQAASAMPPLTLRHPIASLRLLFTNLHWLVGMVTGLAGWVLYVAALAIAPLSLVQAASAGGVGLLALLSWRAAGGRRPRTEVLGIVLATAGLALLAASLAGGHPTSDEGTWAGVAAWTAASIAAASGLTFWALRRRSRGAALGLAAGALYAAGDTATKAVFPGGAHLVLIPTVLCLHGLAFVALQLGFQRGSPLETAGTATLLTNALPIAAGTILYGESLGSGIFALFRLLAFASVVAGAAALSLGGAGRTDARDVPRGTAAETSVSDTAVRRRTPAGLSSGCA